MTNFIITLVVVIMLLMVLLIYIANLTKTARQENKELKEEVAAEKERIGYLMRHIEELSKIKQEEKTISNKIEEAKTDEEISDIVSAIINVNNSKLQNNKKRN